MVAVRLTGWITKNGKLKVELPLRLSPGEVEITLRLAVEESPAKEINEMIRVKPKTSGAEIVTELKAGLIADRWSDLDITVELS